MICRKCKQDVPDGPFCSQCGAKQETAAMRGGIRSRGNGQGTAYKRGATWTAKWSTGSYLDEDGKLRRTVKTKGGFKTKRAALAYASDPPKPTPAAPTLREYWVTYKAGKYKKLSRDKQAAMRKAYERLSSLADIEMDNLTIHQIQEVVDREASTYYTRKDMKTLLSHCFNLALAEKAVTVNLSKYITLPELIETPPEPFTDDEVKKLWEAYLTNHFVGYILTMIYTGMMPGELRGLKKACIDFERNEIVKSGIKTKKRKETPMVFPDFLAPVIRQLCEENKSRVGNFCPMMEQTFYTRYYEALEQAGVRRLVPYSCRHTTATALALQNVAPSVIQEIMRHSKYTTTQRYIHPDVSSMAAAVNQMPGAPSTGKNDVAHNVTHGASVDASEHD